VISERTHRDQQTALQMLGELRTSGLLAQILEKVDGSRSGNDRDEATCRGSVEVEPASE